MSEKPSPEMEALGQMLELVKAHCVQYGGAGGRGALLADAKEIVESVQLPEPLELTGEKDGDTVSLRVLDRDDLVEMRVDDGQTTYIDLTPAEAKQVGHSLLAMASWLERRKA